MLSAGAEIEVFELKTKGGGGGTKPKDLDPKGVVQQAKRADFGGTCRDC